MLESCLVLKKITIFVVDMGCLKLDNYVNNRFQIRFLNDFEICTNPDNYREYVSLSFPIAIEIGAKYYNSDISIWLSVDPMSDKYPGYSPYAYCYNNPIMFRDLWGLEGESSGSKGHARRYLRKSNRFQRTGKSRHGEKLSKYINKHSDKIGKSNEEYDSESNTVSFDIDCSQSGKQTRTREHTYVLTTADIIQGYTVGRDKKGKLSSIHGIRNHFLGLACGCFTGNRGFKMALNNFTSYQNMSNKFGWGLDYSKEISKASKLGKVFKWGGRAFAVLNLHASYSEYKKTGNGLQLFTDSYYTFYAFVPVVGPIVSTIYMGIDNTIGMENVYKEHLKQEMERNDAIQRNPAMMHSHRLGRCER